MLENIQPIPRAFCQKEKKTTELSKLIRKRAQYSNKSKTRILKETETICLCFTYWIIRIIVTKEGCPNDMFHSQIRICEMDI